MRVMVDTNVIISALLFPQSRVSQILENIASHHTLVIASFVVDELRAVTAKKFPKMILAVERLLEKISYELVYTPNQIESGIFEIRDIKDYPVLYTAMTNGVDVLITGDKGFADVDVDIPEIMTPAQYVETYMMDS